MTPVANITLPPRKTDLAGQHGSLGHCGTTGPAAGHSFPSDNPPKGLPRPRLPGDPPSAGPRGGPPTTKVCPSNRSRIAKIPVQSGRCADRPVFPLRPRLPGDDVALPNNDWLGTTPGKNVNMYVLGLFCKPLGKEL